MNVALAEILERRRLLAGITLLAPAYNGGLNGWLDAAVNGITAYLGGPQNVPQYVLTIAPDSNGNLTLSESHVAGTATPQANSPGQIIVTIDYTSISTNPDYSLTQIAGLVTNYMMNTSVDGVRWASLPIDEISLSRGNSVTDTLSKLFDESGIWVNQETYLDPRPIYDAPFSDPPNTIYDNVEFADDYWRTDGENTDADPSGVPINGAYNLELPWVQADSSTFVFPHLGPASYYVGTIDPADIGTNDGDGVIHADWYGNGSTPTTFPSPTQTGFLYTNIVGGTRPVSGLWAASGGTGARTPVSHSGLQWPNISDVASASGSSASTGGTLNINYIQQDQSQADSVTFTLDSDQNPFDGSAYTIGTQSGIASSSTIKSGTFAASLKGVAPGTYYIGATVTDASGLARYDYSTSPITITAAATTTGGLIGGLQSAAASSYNLTSVGASDWAHWGASGSGSAFDHKSTGNSQISNVTRVGSGGFGGYTDPSRNVSWTDGAPASTDAGDNGYIWANNNLGAGYSFTVPASTTSRTVDVYLGGYSSGSTLTASLSDGSANPYTVSFSGSGIYSDVVAITYNAAYSNQTLTLTYTKTSNINGVGGSADLIAAWIPGGTQTATGGSLAGSASTATSSYNLTTLGTSDWTHWGLGGSYGQFDHKSTGNSQISNVTTIGSGNYGGYTDSSRSVSWTDGTPLPTETADSGYIWANNAIGAGYSFTVPASATSSTVDVYVGGYSSGSTLTATLSDGSAAPYTVSFSGNGIYSDVVAITYQAASANQLLTITYAKSSNINGASGSADLIAAWIPGGTQTAPGGGSLAGSSTAAASSYNLTSVGTGDWTHWGLGGNSSQFDHKSTGNSQISNVTKLGSGSYGGYTDPSRGVSWTDGTPLSTESADSGYIWANNAIGAGYSFTAPADTTSRTLYVYVGGYSSGSTLTATLSDGSAAPYNVSFSGNAIYSDVVAITYQAASANQLLTITYTKSSNINGAGGSADLIAAWLGGATSTGAAPAITTNPTSQTLTAGTAATFTAAASGSPTPTVQWMVQTPGGSFTVIPGATSTTLNLGAATTAENGNQYEAVFTNGVGSPATTSAATLTVNPASAGALSGTQTGAATSYNLTTLGTTDWAHWGLGGAYPGFVHKSTGNSQISTVSVIGSSPNVGGYTDPNRNISWTDGSPTTSNADDHGFIWDNGGIGGGFSFTVPASTTPHTLYIYAGGYASGGTLTAQLSDNSAPIYSATASGAAKYNNLYQITFAAASANQTLTITYTLNSQSTPGGSIDLMAAALE